MDDLRFLISLHKDAERQGPGGVPQTELALRLSGLSGRCGLEVADIGCGTGASTLQLAKDLDAHVTAIDFLPEFLEVLEDRAAQAGLAQKIDAVAGFMEELPFADASLDAIWAEGAIYNIGFLRGITEWNRFLKPNGVLAVSELTWLTCDRPEEIQSHWEGEYSEVAPASAKLRQLEAAGYAPIGYFPLPQECWLENYYRPMQNRFETFMERHGWCDEARQIVAAEQAEIDLYERYSEYVSYGFYVAQKLP